MTIALPDRSVRARDTEVSRSVGKRGQYVPTMPYSQFWDPSDWSSQLAPMSRLAGADASAPMSVDEIKALLGESSFVDITPSENETTYIEWDGNRGFASLEVGRTRYAFSFIPHDPDGASRYGESGMLTERNRIAALIRDHS